MPSVAHAGVAQTSLAGLVHKSDRVVVGTVQCLHRIDRDPSVPSEPARTSAEAWLRRPSVQIAEVAISQVLRGDAEPTRVFVLASPTWRCDIATAVEGEEAIFCLEPMGYLAGSAFEKGYALLADGAGLQKIAVSGHGRMPIGGTGDDVYAAYASPLCVPADVARMPRDRTPDIEYEVLALPALLERIRAYIELERGAAWIELDSPARSERDKSWSLSVTAQGLALLRTTPHDNECEIGSGYWLQSGGLEHVFRLAPERIAALVTALGKEDFEKLPQQLGSQLGSPRRITLRGESTTRTVELLTIDGKWMDDSVRADQARRFLRVWRGVRGLFDDPFASDHRVDDRPWLEGPR